MQMAARHQNLKALQFRIGEGHERTKVGLI